MPHVDKYGFDEHGFTRNWRKTPAYRALREREKQGAKLAVRAVKSPSPPSKQKYWMGFRRDPKFEAAVKKYTPTAIRGAGMAAGFLVGGPAGVGISEGARVVSRLASGKSLRQSLPSKKEIATTIALAGLAKYGPKLAKGAVASLRGGRTAYKLRAARQVSSLGKRKVYHFSNQVAKARRASPVVTGDNYDDVVMSSARALRRGSKRAGSALIRSPAAKVAKVSFRKARALGESFFDYGGPIKRARTYDAHIYTSDYRSSALARQARRFSSPSYYRARL